MSEKAKNIIALLAFYDWEQLSIGHLVWSFIKNDSVVSVSLVCGTVWGDIDSIEFNI